MPQLTCPKCGSTQCSRVRREGFLQTVLYPRLGKFPWVCKDCNFDFYASTRGQRKKKAHTHETDTLPASSQQDTLS